jgi:hypothetical protein
MVDYRNIIKNRELRLRIINMLGFIPSAPYLKLVYRVKTGKKLNLNNPKGFNEKLNWLKLNEIHPEYTQLVDKYEVRRYVQEKLGSEYLFPILGAWKSFDDIDFSALPDSFVLKCTHDSGSVKIIKDKGTINREELKSFFDGRMKVNAYNMGREYPYKDVEPRIIAEKFMSSSDGKAPRDYKFFCFDGEPKIMFVATDRETDVTHTLFDMNFKQLDIDYIHRHAPEKLEKPETFEQMKEIARVLSKGMKFVRIDLYELDREIYFGEFTFFPAGGFWLMKPDAWEQKLGDWIKINTLAV